MDAEEFKLQDAHVLVSEFGESYSPSSEIRRAEDCHTPLAMRPPEARFGPQAPLSYSADIWSLAVAAWDILGMKPVFSNDYITEYEMVSEQIDVLGPLPKHWWERWEERGEFFDQAACPTDGREVSPILKQAFEKDVQSYRQKFKDGEVWGGGGEEARAIFNLVRQMLTFQPEKRPTIEDILESEWMVNGYFLAWGVAGAVNRLSISTIDCIYSICSYCIQITWSICGGTWYQPISERAVIKLEAGRRNLRQEIMRWLL